jgi:hypothetical protein
MDPSALKHACALKRMTEERFDRISEIFRMDEVNGWTRPFPKIPKARERHRLADVTMAEIDEMIGSEEEQSDGTD